MILPQKYWGPGSYDKWIRVGWALANISKKIFDEAQAITTKFAEKLNYVGTLNLEFMIDHKDNLYFNEYANRPHNGFWHSVNSYKYSQFSTHIKAMRLAVYSFR